MLRSHMMRSIQTGAEITQATEAWVGFAKIQNGSPVSPPFQVYDIAGNSWVTTGMALDNTPYQYTKQRAGAYDYTRDLVAAHLRKDYLAVFDPNNYTYTEYYVGINDSTSVWCMCMDVNKGLSYCASRDVMICFDYVNGVVNGVVSTDFFGVNDMVLDIGNETLWCVTEAGLHEFDVSGLTAANAGTYSNWGHVAATDTSLFLLGVDINKTAGHIYVTDGLNNGLRRYTYTTGSGSSLSLQSNYVFSHKTGNVAVDHNNSGEVLVTGWDYSGSGTDGFKLYKFTADLTTQLQYVSTASTHSTGYLEGGITIDPFTNKAYIPQYSLTSGAYTPYFTEATLGSGTISSVTERTVPFSGGVVNELGTIFLNGGGHKSTRAYD